MRRAARRGSLGQGLGMPGWRECGSCVHACGHDGMLWSTVCLGLAQNVCGPGPTWPHSGGSGGGSTRPFMRRQHGCCNCTQLCTSLATTSSPQEPRAARGLRVGTAGSMLPPPAGAEAAWAPAPKHRLARSASAEPTELLSAIRRGLPQLPPLDAHTIAKLKVRASDMAAGAGLAPGSRSRLAEPCIAAAAAAGPAASRRRSNRSLLPHLQEQALQKAAHLQQQTSQSAKEGLHGARLVSTAPPRCWALAGPCSPPRACQPHGCSCMSVRSAVAQESCTFSMPRCRWPLMWRAATPRPRAARWASCCTAPPRPAPPWASPACWCATVAAGGPGKKGPGRLRRSPLVRKPCPSSSTPTRTHMCLQVCLYFVNSVYDAVAAWQWMQQPEVQERARRWPQHYPVARCGALRGLGLLLQ